MEDRLEKIKKKHYSESVGSEFGVGEDDVDWLIEQAEMIEKIKKFSNAEDITLGEFAKVTLSIVEGREIPKRVERS
jgi:hypothetical protein